MCKSPKQGLLFIAFCGVLLLTGLFFLDPSAGSSQSAITLRGGDRAMLELVLDRYKVLARNVTHRVESLERAVLDLREGLRKARSHHHDHVEEPARAQGSSPPAAKLEDVDPDAGLPPEEPPEKGEAKSEEKGEAKSEEKGEVPDVPFPFPMAADDDPEETEEERAQRQEAEENLQKEMIFFNKTTGKYLRYRSDSKCGSQVPPLPDGEMVECPPTFESPCCSSLGWCGRSGDHCKCEMCSDYRYKMNVTFVSMKLKRAKRECDSIAADLGAFSSPEECARVAADDGECGKMIMFSFNYPNWGCRCCSIDTSEGEEEKSAWNVYAYEVKDVLPETAEPK